MTERDRMGFGGLGDGLSYIVLGLLALAIFVFYGESADIVEVIASLAFVGIGVTAALAPKISPLFADLNDYWKGLFWTLCGLGILGLSLLSLHRWISGVILGGAFVIYGALIAVN